MNANKIISRLAAVLLLTGCQESQSIYDSAVAKIFMPQSRVEGGIVYNEYNVPEQDDPDVRHHFVEDGVLHVILGVKSSGGESGGFSVKVSADDAYTAASLPTIEDAIALGSEYYSLPSEVSVPKGKTGAVFYLDVNLDALIRDYTDSFSSKFVVTVRISDPSDFELNEARSRTLVIIDGRSFIPQSVQVSLVQATALNGGVTNHYPVPFDASSNNYSFDSDALTLTIPLTISRNGEKPFDSFTVDVALDAAAAAAQLPSIEGGVLLDASVLTLPATATVKQGQTSADFNLKAELSSLVTGHPEWAKSKLVTAVTISNPTLYELETSASTAVIIIDARSFYPKPEPVNLVKGGAFEDGDEAFWTPVNSDGGGGRGWGVRPAQASVRDGCLKFTITERCFHTFWQAVEITEPGEYQMVLTYHNNGSTDAAGRVYAAFCTQSPVTDATFAHQNYPAARAENNIKSAYHGDFFVNTVTQKFQGLTSEGKFTVDAAGTYYMVLGVEMWGGGLNAYFDDCKLYKSE